MQLFKSKIEKIIAVLDELGTKEIKHVQGKGLYHHLIRVQKMLARWGCDESTQIAGLTHSLYSTEYFKHPVFNIEKRSELQSILGNEIENLVYHFALLDRKSLSYDESNKSFAYKNYVTGENHPLQSTEAIPLIHILLANEIDHLEKVGIGAQVWMYKRFIPFKTFLNEGALGELAKLIPLETKSTPPEKSKPFIRFIAHSGVQIANDESSLVVDPWLYDSKHAMPIIDGLDPTQRTIDYLIPEPKNTAYGLSPDVVCLSHFHTHHSPLREIIEFAKIKPITIVCPLLDAEKLETLKKKVGTDVFECLTFIFIEKDTVVVVGDFHIRAFTHRSEGFLHLIFHVQLFETSLVHIVDASADDDNRFSLKLGEDWKRLENLRPDFLFIGAGGHLARNLVDGQRFIGEATTLTPAQAAKLTVRIMPKKVGIIGIYNHSIWDDRYEMALSVGEAEAQFYWCLSFLAPSIVVKKLLPGDIFS